METPLPTSRRGKLLLYESLSVDGEGGEQRRATSGIEQKERRDFESLRVPN